MNKIPSVSEFPLKYPEASLLTVVPKSEDNYEKSESISRKRDVMERA